MGPAGRRFALGRDQDGGDEMTEPFDDRIQQGRNIRGIRMAVGVGTCKDEERPILIVECLAETTGAIASAFDGDAIGQALAGDRTDAAA